MNGTVLEIKDVCKKFDNSTNNAVDHVSFSVSEGDFVTILGASGSGKTTLLKLINRIHELTSGDILFEGKSIYDLDGSDYRKKIGYVIQQGGLFPHWTVGENIATVPKLKNWDDERINLRVDELLELVKLDPEIYRNRYPGKLSGGEQQRVGIARALAAEPNLMLMDEPFGALDAITRSILQRELLRLHKSTNITILFVTHDVSEALMLGNKVMIMNHGKIQQYDDSYNIVMHPVNEFVSKLVKTAGNFFDKMGIISVGDYIDDELIKKNKESMLPYDVACSRNEKMSSVYRNLVEENHVNCAIKDNSGKLIGIITNEDIRELARSLDR